MIDSFGRVATLRGGAHADGFFENMTVILDNSDHRRCHFSGCHIVWNGGTPVTLIENHFEGCLFLVKGNEVEGPEFIALLLNQQVP